MIKALIFDFDGVIVDSIAIKTMAFAELFRKEDRRITKKIVAYHLDNSGVSRYDKFKYIYKGILKRPLSQQKFQKLCGSFESLVVDSVIKAPYIKGAKVFLENYISRFEYFLVSATPQEEIEKITRKKNIESFFKIIYGAPTPKSEAVRNILLKENLRPAEIAYIGDAMSDYLAAKENSVKFIALTHPEDPVFAGIDCLKIEDFTQLSKISGL